MRIAIALMLLAACGAPTVTPPASTAGDECPPDDAFARAEQALAQCRGRHAADPGWPARTAYDALVPRLAAHLASLDPPRALAPDDVQPLAESIWELLDQVSFPAGAEQARARAEDAAEGILRDRDARAAPGAAIEALDAVTQVGVVADPSHGVDACAAEALRAAEARVEAGACVSGAER